MWASAAQRTGQQSRCRAAALIAYFDTSALIKTLLLESGSQLADELWSRSSMRIASGLVYPEARAELAAATRGGRIDEHTQRTTVTRAACRRDRREPRAARLCLVTWDRDLAVHGHSVAPAPDNGRVRVLAPLSIYSL
jgi:predicted nucleic acid-binding protein